MAMTVVDAAFECDRVARTALAHGFKRVALQFPDEMLAESADVVDALRGLSQGAFEVFVLADTTYGSFDVDEVAAQHVDADVIVHYGRASLLRTARLPVLFVFGKQDVDVDDCWARFCELFHDDDDPSTTTIVLLYDVMCAHAIDAWQQRWQASGRFANVVVSRVVHEWNLPPQPSSSAPSDVAEVGRQFTLPEGVDLSTCKMFFIGTESPTLTHLMMAYNKNQFYTYDPQTLTARRETLDVNRALKRRYYLVQRAKDANIIGIIVATLGTAGYMAIIEHLKRLIRAAGKRVFTFVMGKLNVAKMANFMEVDVYVIVASPENSLVDSKDFHKPVVTPFELEMALTPSREWTGEYLIDFAHVLPGLIQATHETEQQMLEGNDSGPRFSLVSQSYKAVPTVATAVLALNLYDASSSQAVALRQPGDVVLALTPADLLNSRSFRGLEPRIGESTVSLAVEGRRGVPRGYNDEPTSLSSPPSSSSSSQQ